MQLTPPQVGTEEFGCPELPEPHRPVRSPFDVLDPMMAARISIECGVPMAKVDPARFD